MPQAAETLDLKVRRQKNILSVNMVLEQFFAIAQNHSKTKKNKRQKREYRRIRVLEI